MQHPRTSVAIALMIDFAEHTGLDSGQAGRRYLWTDTFSVVSQMVSLSLIIATQRPNTRSAIPYKLWVRTARSAVIA